MAWQIIATKQSPTALLALGPRKRVKLSAPGSNQFIGANALFDTGADVSCIRPDIAQRLGLSPCGGRAIRFLGAETENVPKFSCRVLFQEIGGVELVHEFAAHPALDKTDAGVLVGRDLLSGTRVHIDFAAGGWEWHLPVSEDETI